MTSNARMRKLAAIGLLPLGLLALLVLLLVTALALIWRIVRATYTGVADLDHYRWRVAFEVVRQFGAKASPRLGRAVMAIIHAGVAVLKAKLNDDPRLDNVRLGHGTSGGDLIEALRLYNGWSLKADTYRDDLLAYATRTWGRGGLDA